MMSAVTPARFLGEPKCWMETGTSIRCVCVCAFRGSLLFEAGCKKHNSSETKRKISILWDPPVLTHATTTNLHPRNHPQSGFPRQKTAQEIESLRALHRRQEPACSVCKRVCRLVDGHVHSSPRPPIGSCGLGFRVRHCGC